jgi:hypothetical protein
MKFSLCTLKGGRRKCFKYILKQVQRTEVAIMRPQGKLKVNAY